MEKANYDDAIASFEEMGISPRLKAILSTKEIDSPTRLQQRAILPILQGRNVILKAQSGTGRMAAFVIAALQKVDPRTRECQVLILTPDRGVAVEFWRLLRDLGGAFGIACRTCLDDVDGIVEVEEEVGRVVCGSDTSVTPHVVVGTPDRVLDYIQAGELNSSSLGLLMVADLDIFLRKSLDYALECIFNTLTPSSSRFDSKLQVALYFDLQTPELLHTVDQLTHKQIPNEVVKIFVRKVSINLNHVRHYYLDIDREDWKLDTLCDLFETLTSPQMVVFCNTREKLEWLTHALQSPTSPLYTNNDQNITVGCMHADHTALERAAVMRSYRRGEIRILILATPLVRENIDVTQLPLVVGYDLPLDQEVYLRRCRVSSWQRLVCISFVKGQEEMGLLRDIERSIGSEVLEMPMNIADYV
ncbi:translation initiation factor eIF4A [Linnemannia schmuckeri]|uniref:ATP-dependent RNA helicase n=1 Tax=Linnemannia schmuckeri TaxID=64567 RepID=A0A9P5S5K7_9FUNG|nr:translation initiation factor eIF4A [Linnemannia schmuckeri]